MTMSSGACWAESGAAWNIMLVPLSRDLIYSADDHLLSIVCFALNILC